MLFIGVILFFIVGLYFLRFSIYLLFYCSGWCAFYDEQKKKLVWFGLIFVFDCSFSVSFTLAFVSLPFTYKSSATSNVYVMGNYFFDSIYIHYKLKIIVNPKRFSKVCAKLPLCIIPSLPLIELSNYLVSFDLLSFILRCSFR